MEKKNKIKVLLTLLFLVATNTGYAKTEKYLIVFMNCQSIIFGNQKMRQGNIVSEDMVIKWTNSRQRIIVKNTSSHEEYKIDSYCVGNKNAKSLKDIIEKNLYSSKEDNRVLIRDEHLGKRGASSSSHYSNYDYLLMDSLHFETFSSPNSNIRAEAVWNTKKGTPIVTPVSRTPNGKFYIITPSIFKGEKPQDVKLTIREVNDEQNWTNRVYKDISIIFIPEFIGKKQK